MVGLYEKESRPNLLGCSNSVELFERDGKNETMWLGLGGEASPIVASFSKMVIPKSYFSFFLVGVHVRYHTSYTG